VAPRATNLDAVLDPWLEQELDELKRQAVLEAILWAVEHFEDLRAQPALYGHPLKRLIEVPEAEVALSILLPLPMAGIHLLSIDPL
jgi:hypothetical protein